MKHPPRYLLLSIALLAPGSIALAADTETTPVANARVDHFAAGKKAIDEKSWAQAVDSFSMVTAEDPKNADAYNYLGFSHRWLGRYEMAFAAYAKALALNPDHRGALHYSGIAYLKVGRKDAAEAQLSRLKKACGACDEAIQLAKAIADTAAAGR